MDPISAIANAVGQVFSGVVTMVEGRRESKYGRLPDWLSSRDFQRKDYSLELIIGGLLLTLIIVIIVMARSK